MARWVLPVLVGPSTAVTPAPRARDWAFGFCEKDRDITLRFRDGGGAEGFLYHNATAQGRAVKLWNESGTKRARITDSGAV